MGKRLWTIISYIFHPAIMPALGICIVLWCDPNLYWLTADYTWIKLLAEVFLCTYLLPLIMGGLLRLTGTISNVINPSENDRKILLSFTALFFILGYYLFHDIPTSGQSLKIFMLGINISIILTLIASLFTKVSFHSVGAGGLLGTVMGLMKYTQQNLFIWLFGAFAIVLFVALSRYKLKAHDAFNIYVGLIIGIAAQALVFFISTY